MKNMLNNDDFWSQVGPAYRTISSISSRKILSILLTDSPKSIRSGELMQRSTLSESDFHNSIRCLVQYGILERHLNQKRSVYYSITNFGQKLLKPLESLSEIFQKNRESKNTWKTV